VHAEPSHWLQELSLELDFQIYLCVEPEPKTKDAFFERTGHGNCGVDHQLTTVEYQFFLFQFNWWVPATIGHNPPVPAFFFSFTWMVFIPPIYTQTIVKWVARIRAKNPCWLK
jgi:hypothetical protein